MTKVIICLIAGMSSLLWHGAAPAAPLTVFCPGAVRSVVTALARDFGKQTGGEVQFVLGTAGSVYKKAASGEPGDVIITTSTNLDALIKQGKVAGGSRADVGTMGVGVAVRTGVPAPDISTPEAFRKAMLNARSVMYADPALGGQSGIHTAQVFQRLGIAQAMKPKTTLFPGAPQGLKDVASGKIEIGIGQVSEILAAKGVILVGPFPASLQKTLTFSVGILTAAHVPQQAQSFIRFITNADARARFRKAGFGLPG